MTPIRVWLFHFSLLAVAFHFSRAMGTVRDFVFPSFSLRSTSLNAHCGFVRVAPQQHIIRLAAVFRQGSNHEIHRCRGSGVVFCGILNYYISFRSFPTYVAQRLRDPLVHVGHQVILI